MRPPWVQGHCRRGKQPVWVTSSSTVSVGWGTSSQRGLGTGVGDIDGRQTRGGGRDSRGGAIPEGPEHLPGGQKQPSTQWSSHSWERSGLEQVSTQGEPHSWCRVFRGHVWAVGGRRRLAQEATPAPLLAMCRGSGRRGPLAQSSCFLGEAGGEGSVGPMTWGQPPAPTWVQGEPCSTCHGHRLAPRCPGLAPPPALLPSSRRGPPRGSACRGSSARGQASCPGPPPRGTHGRGRGPSSSAAAPQRGRTGGSTRRRWHTGRWGSGTGPGCRRPRTPRRPPARGTERRRGPAACCGRHPPGRQDRGCVLPGARAGTPPCSLSQAREPPPPRPLHPSLFILSSVSPPTSPSTALSVHPGFHPVGQLSTPPQSFSTPDTLPCSVWSQLGDP